MYSAAMLSNHHLPITNDGFVTRDCFILENSFGARNLASTRDENPTQQFFRYDNHLFEQYVALTITPILSLNQHGHTSKQQADAKGVNTHQAVFFASSTQLLALLAATVSTTQRDIPCRREQKDKYVEYEQQDWQAELESDKRFRFHRKQDAKDNTKLVNGDGAFFICLADNDLVDGQPSYAAG